MTEFWNRLVPAAVLAIVISFFGFGALIFNITDVSVLLTRMTTLEMALIIFAASFIGGGYLSTIEEEDLFRNGLALGALIAFGELVLVVPMVHNFIGNWQLDMLNSVSNMAVLFFVGAIFGSLLGMVPKYFQIHFRRVE